MSDPTHDTLTYATPVTARSLVAPGAWLLVGGLGLVFLGGCFLVGVLMIVEGNHRLSDEQLFLEVVLYSACFVCFAVGAAVGFMGVRRLLAAGRN